jgi:NAD(P)-dependent dehydrogenase (short-subunit alcohol dehydrogenase family)
MFLVQALAPAMAERGSGAIVNLGSWIAQVGVASGGLYAASKAAIEQLTRGWAADYVSAGIRVNAVSPGVTLTDGTSAAAEHLDAMVAPFPAGRTARPEEIAAAVVYLASDEASYLHGTVLVADGGALATR